MKILITEQQKKIISAGLIMLKESESLTDDDYKNFLELYLTPENREIAESMVEQIPELGVFLDNLFKKYKLSSEADAISIDTTIPAEELEQMFRRFPTNFTKNLTIILECKTLNHGWGRGVIAKYLTVKTSYTELFDNERPFNTIIAFAQSLQAKAKEITIQCTIKTPNPKYKIDEDNFYDMFYELKDSMKYVVEKTGVHLFAIQDGLTRIYFTDEEIINTNIFTHTLEKYYTII